MLNLESEIPIMEVKGDGWKLKQKWERDKKASFIFICMLSKNGEKNWPYTILRHNTNIIETHF